MCQKWASMQIQHEQLQMKIHCILFHVTKASKKTPYITQAKICPFSYSRVEQGHQATPQCEMLLNLQPLSLQLRGKFRQIKSESKGIVETKIKAVNPVYLSPSSHSHSTASQCPNSSPPTSEKSPTERAPSFSSFPILKLGKMPSIQSDIQ